MNALESLSNINYCYDYVVNQISVDLLLYAHIPTALTALAFGLFLLYKSRSIASSSLFAVCLGFALWSFLNLITWFVFIGGPDTMFTWSLIDLVGLVFFFFAYRFLYSFITDKDLPPWQMGIGLLLVLPTLVTTFLGLNLVGFDTSICESLENENVVFYTYVAQFIFILATLHLGISKYRTATVKKKKDEILLATVGVTLFLLFFFLANFFVLILINYTIIDYAYNFAIYGLFGMPILLAYLTYLIVKYQAFNVKLIAAQALVFGVVVLIGSEFFFVSSTSNIILVGVTFVLACIGGYFLVRSVKNEVEQKEQIEKLAKNLEHANERLKILDRMKSEFVSIASHQLRSPLTAIRGYASMLLEGSYGVFPPKAREAITKIDDSSRYMALSIEDYLNVSRIESGNMKYEIGDFNLKEVAEKVVDEMRPIALKKGLLMVFRSDCNGSCSVNADIGKTRQVITNLIDNAMKYTPKGSIDVVAHDDMKKKKMYVTIKDTGVGMSKETQGEVFEKFTRAKNANRINVTGTGLGLFVAKKMVQEMGGRVWAESEGEGKGSTFHIELPLLPGAFK